MVYFKKKRKKEIQKKKNKKFLFHSPSINETVLVKWLRTVHGERRVNLKLLFKFCLAGLMSGHGGKKRRLRKTWDSSWKSFEFRLRG